MTFANQKHNLMLGELKDYFINQLCFSSRLTGLTSMISFQKSSKVSVPAFCPQILVSKLLCFQNFAHAQKQVFREAFRFYFIFTYLFTVSFKTGNIIKLLFSWGEEVYNTLPYQIYFSYLHSYMANYIWNIKVFPNVMKNQLFIFSGRFLSFT